MRSQHCYFLAGTIFVAPSQATLAQVTVAPGYEIEVLVSTPAPGCLAIPSGPSAAAFGNYLYFAIPIYDAHQSSGPPDRVRRVDLSTRVVEDFFDLPYESDPIGMTFGPGAPYTTTSTSLPTIAMEAWAETKAEQSFTSGQRHCRLANNS